MPKTILVKFKTEKAGSACEIAFEVDAGEWADLDDEEKSEVCLGEILDSGMFEYWYAEVY